ncbi:MAG: hypothetical protein K2M97_01650, partial [Muribaculaceae bacterium]|nr:hypothetical protein [Muribaculaceae bacterium]
MIKNLILTLISIIGIGTSTALSQQITGSWEAIASYGGIPTRMIETSDKVYTLSQGNLSSYDKKSGEIYYYNKSNILNGDRIANIFYNYDRDYLLISYDDDNIDVLTDDRRVINFPEIMNASLTSAKTINNVAFSGPRAYLATGYGLTVLNVDKGIVEQSGIYDFPIAAVAVTSDRVFVCITTGSTGTPGTWSAPLTSSLNRFESFTKALNDQVMNLEALSDNTILGIGNSMVKLTYNAETDKITMQVIRGGFNKTKLQRTRDGFFAHDSGSKFVMFLDKDGENRREVTLPAAVAGNAVSCYAGDESKLWVGNSEGYGLYDVTTGQFTINRMKPEGTSGPNVGLIKSAADGSIYFMTMSDSNINTASYINNVFVDKLSPDGTY